MKARPFASVEEYLSKLPSKPQRTLQHLRGVINAAAPGAEEAISYNMPAVHFNGTLVYYAAFKDHYSFFPGSAGARKKFARELAPFAGGKGTVRFTDDKPLPDSLVTAIVKFRLLENGSRGR